MHYLSTHPGVVLIALGVLFVAFLSWILLNEKGKAGWRPDDINLVMPPHSHGATKRWPPGQSPLDLFEEGLWLSCANALMVCLHDLGNRRMTQDAVADEGILRELMLLEAGVGSRTTLEGLREEVEAIEGAHALQGAMALGGMI